MRAAAQSPSPGLLAEPAMIAILLLLAGIAGIGGLALYAARVPAEHVCTVVLPAHTSAIGAVAELAERLDGADCRRGDVLAIRGDIRLDALAHFCDFARAVTLEPPAAETGRPTGALCLYAGQQRGLRRG